MKAERIAAEQLKNAYIDGRVTALYKATRVGATISLVISAVKSGKRVVLVCPTRRIIKEVERRVSEILGPNPKIAAIYSNAQLCKLLDPKLKIPFQFLGDCFKCQYNNARHCNLQRLLQKEYNLYLLTYQKLRSLILNDSSHAKKMVDRLCSCDVCILDEFTTALLADVKTETLIEWSADSAKTMSASDNCSAIFKAMHQKGIEITVF